MKRLLFLSIPPLSLLIGKPRPLHGHNTFKINNVCVLYVEHVAAVGKQCMKAALRCRAEYERWHLGGFKQSAMHLIAEVSTHSHHISPRHTNALAHPHATDTRNALASRTPAVETFRCARRKGYCWVTTG